MTMIYDKVYTSNGLLPLYVDREEWLRKSGQVGARHPLDPVGRCMTCGDQKFAYVDIHVYEPEEVCRQCRNPRCEGTHKK